MKKILGLIIVSILMLSIVGTISAEEIESIPENIPFNFMSWFQHTFGIQDFSIAGQERHCDVYPKKTLYFYTNGKNIMMDIDASDYCSSGHGLIDLFTNNWNPFREYKDSVTRYCGFIYDKCIAEIYCCDHDECSKDSQCEDWEGSGSECKRSYEKDPYIDYDFSSYKYCTVGCSDSDITCWREEQGSCVSRTYDCSYGTYPSCPTSYKYTSKSKCEASLCTSHANYNCYSNDVYWYDSCGKREDKKQECGTPGCANRQCKSVTTDCTEGQEKCVGSGTTSNEVVGCIDGKWVEFGGIGSANCISGTICDVGDIGTSVCYTPYGLICDYDLKCESGQGETITTCPTDCCTEPDTTCNYATKEYYICKGTEWENQGKVEGKCGYTEGGCHGTKALGSMSYCSSTCKCDEGEGDCDGNTQCNTGLVCVNNVGAKYGFSSGTDVCEKTGGCTYHASQKCYSNDVYWYDSCGNRETKKEECGTLGCPTGSSSCGSAKQCQSNADSNNDGGVDRSELGSYINKWKAGTKTRSTLGKAIMEWVDGC